MGWGGALDARIPERMLLRRGSAGYHWGDVALPQAGLATDALGRLDKRLTKKRGFFL